MIKPILLISLLVSISYGQVVVTQVTTTAGIRTKVTSTVNTLICSFDNISGATTTIHINCKVPLGSILIETTTPRFTPLPVLPPGTNGSVGGNIGGFKDDNGNMVVWLLQQLTKGVITYQITDNTGAANSGTFTPQTVGSVIPQPNCDCCWVIDPMNIWMTLASNGILCQR